MNTYEYKIRNNKREITHRNYLKAESIDEAYNKLRCEFPKSLIFIFEI